MQKLVVNSELEPDALRACLNLIQSGRRFRAVEGLAERQTFLRAQASKFVAAASYRPAQQVLQLSLPQPKVVEVKLCARQSEDERVLAQLAAVARTVLGEEKLDALWPDAGGLGQGVPGGASAEDFESGTCVLREVRAVLADFARKRKSSTESDLDSSGAFGVRCVGASRACVAECLRQDVGALCVAQVGRFLDAAEARLRRGALCAGGQTGS